MSNIFTSPKSLDLIAKRLNIARCTVDECLTMATVLTTSQRKNLLHASRVLSEYVHLLEVEAEGDDG